ncbi:hypothetical protein ES708_13704 [subsurface metagenome]
MGTHNYPGSLLAATEARLAELDAANIPADVDELKLEASHESRLFPDLTADIDLTCILTAGTGKAFGAWTELEDSSENKLSTIAASSGLHVSALRVRDTDETNVLYVIEIGYGPDAEHVTVIGPHDFGSGDKKIDSDEQVRVRPPSIPKGQKVYGRLKCETDGAIVTIVVRYHPH